VSKKILVYLLLSLSLSLTACANFKQTADNTSHKTDSIKESNGLYILPDLDHGLIQSPINIRSFKQEKTNTHEITFHYQDKIKAVENLGHTVQLDFSAGSTISYEGLEYDFKQMHFHTPSEHLIDGMTFPMEMHIVTSIPAKDKNSTPRYLVIGILFKEGQTNKFIDEFLNLIPKTEHSMVPLKEGAVKLDDLFSSTELHDIGNFYHYQGSLTTPPYTETVQWFVFKYIVEASPKQIEAISTIEGNNARHIQGVFTRGID
jgi:carbonic anhydrase